MKSLPRRLDLAVKEELRNGEIIRWSGQPIAFRRTIFDLWLFFVPWTAISVFWTQGMIEQEGLGSNVHLYGLPFVLIGVIFLLLSPPWRYFKSTRTVYVITNFRAFTLSMVKGVNIRNYYPVSFSSYEKHVCADGSGDLIMEIEHYRSRDGELVTRRHGFFSVKKVNDAESAIDYLIESNL